MQPFDHTKIDDAGLRIDFAHIMLRAEKIAHSLQQKHGESRNTVIFQYISEFDFNAYARPNGDQYLIELNASIPLFSIILFYKLLADPDMLPDLSADGAKASELTLPFVIDPADFNRRADWRIELNDIRAFAAGTLADFCSTFVVCHEFGHILAGHVEGYRHYFDEGKVAELVSYSSRPVDDLEIRQAWEYDADAIAAVLLANFVEELAERTEPRTRTVFSHPEGFHREHVLATVVAALEAFFTYVQGAAVKFAKHSSHPHPYVRALYLKDMLLQAVAAYGPIDSKVFHRLLDQRIDEVEVVLERIGLVRPSQYTAAFMRRAEREAGRLMVLSRRHQHLCQAWRWLPPFVYPEAQTP